MTPHEQPRAPRERLVMHYDVTTHLTAYFHCTLLDDKGGYKVPLPVEFESFHAAVIVRHGPWLRPSRDNSTVPRTVTETAPLLHTPLFERHKALGARMVPFAGYSMPVQYVGLVKEHTAVRQAAGLFDVSHMGELWLRGEGAVHEVDRLVTNSIAKLPDGKAAYTLCCSPTGGILDDLIVYRVRDDQVLVVCNATNRAKIVAHMQSHLTRPDLLEDLSDDTVLLALQGPMAQATLSTAGAEAHLASLKRFGVARGRLGDFDTWVARTGYTGEDGFEIFCTAQQGPELWDRLLAASNLLQPIGLGARDTLRLEAGLLLYGNDMDEQVHPYQAGLGRFVKLKAGDFIGREALVRAKADPPDRRLVGIEMRGRGIARQGYPILDISGEEVGRVTSGCPSPTLGKPIALGYVRSGLASPGTSLGVEIRKKVIEATVCKYPFYVRA